MVVPALPQHLLMNFKQIERMAEITNIQIDVIKRVLYCLQELKALALIPSVKDFLGDCGVVYTRYTEMDRAFRQGRGGSRYKTIEAEVLYNLVIKFGVNADWLITGRGSMFAKK